MQNRPSALFFAFARREVDERSKDMPSAIVLTEDEALPAFLITVVLEAIRTRRVARALMS